MIDNSEHEEIMSILEEMEDEQLAVYLLKQFNDLTAELGQLILNLDQNLSHDQWKKDCDKKKVEVDAIVKEIKSF